MNRLCQTFDCLFFKILTVRFGHDAVSHSAVAQQEDVTQSATPVSLKRSFFLFTLYSYDYIH